MQALYKVAGLKGQPVCFIFTDAEVKDEAFLEYINQLLMTGTRALHAAHGQRLLGGVCTAVLCCKLLTSCVFLQARSRACSPRMSWMLLSTM